MQSLSKKFITIHPTARMGQGLYPWLVWGLSAIFFFAEYFARVSPSVMVPQLMQDFNVTALALGNLSACFYYAYLAMQIPVGVLVDRFGAHRLLTLTAFICGISCFIFGVAKDIFWIEFSRFLLGFSASFAFISALKLATVWFPAKRLGLLAGLTQALGMLGASVGEAPVSAAVNNIGWRFTMIIMAGIFILLTVFLGWIIRDRPVDNPIDVEENIAIKGSLLAGLKAVLKNTQTWFNAIFAGLLYAPMAVFAEFWGVTYLSKIYSISTTQAATAVGCMFIGWGIGGPLAGAISDYLQLRKPIMLFSTIASLLFLSAVLYIPHLPLYGLYLLLFLYGVSNTGVAISYALSTEINPYPISGTSLAFTNMASVIIGAALQPVIGWFLDYYWDGHLEYGVRSYSITEFQTAMISLPVCLILAIFIVFFIKETYAKSYEQRSKGNAI